VICVDRALSMDPVPGDLLLARAAPLRAIVLRCPATQSCREGETNAQVCACFRCVQRVSHPPTPALSQPRLRQLVVSCAFFSAFSGASGHSFCRHRHSCTVQLRASVRPDRQRRCGKNALLRFLKILRSTVQQEPRGGNQRCFLHCQRERN
jgi:hypothetical protein